ncbi:MAG: FAD/NAD(P)-binding protein [Candidatus Marinimicrobia bacterium]|nr:FAD/NAD(P)-binding protein [Candidatus Neomarinimicrobiota bacterium]MBL7022498.1 FAD/NAD(P)-binding protein [Candidatus Neomarinimicrobiota bacterium]MBL7108647.1 FAD/NAD(P)-binding protein [Candidatus Neomarinimicrobiota bacterium]
MIKTKNGELKELYYPTISEITKIEKFTDKEKWFEIRLPNGDDLQHQPGQFVEVSLFGIGEAPISVTSSPTKKGAFELCVRETGMLTEVMHRMESGDKIGIRGPFGQGYDIDAMKGKDILIIGGGIGIVPLRSLINYVIDNRQDFGKLIICYGAKTPDELLYPEELKRWEKDDNIEFHLTVDQGDENWSGNVGVITTLIPGLKLDLKNTIAAVTGPPIMYKFVLLSLQSKGLPDENVYMSLERRMKCGVGKCGHCQINHSYVCQDGPVYHYPTLKTMEEAI